MNSLQMDGRRAYELSLLELPALSRAGVEVRLVAIDLSAPLDAPEFSVLDDDERSRAARFLRREDAVRHAATRAALREVLGARLGQPAQAVRFVRDEAGRPRLADAVDARRADAPCIDARRTDAPLDFNISHSGAFALIALSTSRRVGVDIEAQRERFDWRAVAKSVFAPREIAYLESLPEGACGDAFYDAWTAKEALVKALGTGISLSGGIVGFEVLGGERGVGRAPRVRLVEPTMSGDAGVAAYEALWCPAPEGYAACVAWSRDARAPTGA
jgi:4'-phosphopantetheinyl transferase